MAFFKSKEKYLAKSLTPAELKNKYERSEAKLKQAADNGSIKQLEAEMRQHHDYEYAMLYQSYKRGLKQAKKKKRAARKESFKRQVKSFGTKIKSKFSKKRR